MSDLAPPTPSVGRSFKATPAPPAAPAASAASRSGRPGAVPEPLHEDLNTKEMPLAQSPLEAAPQRATESATDLHFSTPALRVRGGTEAAAGADPANLAGPPAAAGLAKQAESKRYLRRYPADQSPLQEVLPAQSTNSRFFDPYLITDANGRATLQLPAPESVHRYSLHLDAHGAGRVGSRSWEFTTQVPLQLAAELPAQIMLGDRLELPVQVGNSLSRPLSVTVAAQETDGLQWDDGAQATLELEPGARDRASFSLLASQPQPQAAISIRATADDLSAVLGHTLRINPPGTTVVQSYAGQLADDQTFDLPLPAEVIADSVQVTLWGFPTPASEWYAALEDLSREGAPRQDPAATQYVADFVLSNLEKQPQADPELTRIAQRLRAESIPSVALGMEAGRTESRLFGDEPSAASSLSYLKNSTAPPAVPTESLDRNSALDVAQFANQAKQAAVPEPVQEQLNSRLAQLQQEDGSVGLPMDPVEEEQLETTALAANAWRELPQWSANLRRAQTWLSQQRQADGGFGSPEDTALALTALTATPTSPAAQTGTDTIALVAGDETVAQQTFSGETLRPVRLDWRPPPRDTADQPLTLKVHVTRSMPYVLELRYNIPIPSELPNDTPVVLSPRLGAASATVGDVVPLWIEVQNQTEQALPSTTVSLGLPAGLQLRPEQLENDRHAGLIDAYELRGSEVQVTWHQLPPANMAEAKQLRWDLVARFSGTFEGAGGRAFPTQQPTKTQGWCAPLKVQIEPR